MTGHDPHAERELELYACNFSGEHYNTVARTLSKKHESGVYDMERAIGYIERNLVTPAAKDYLTCHCSMTESLRGMFPKSFRLAVAESIEDQLRDEFRLGNYYN